MTFFNTHSLNNLTPTRMGRDLLSLINPCADALLSVVLIKQSHEQDTNYFGMT